MVPEHGALCEYRGDIKIGFTSPKNGTKIKMSKDLNLVPAYF